MSSVLNKDREKRRIYTARYKKKYPGIYTNIQRRFRETISGRSIQLLNGAKRRSREKNLKCTITRAWIKKKIETGKCELTGISFELKRKKIGNRHPLSPSVHRRNNKKGYTPKNCRIVISAVNVAINEFGEDFFEDMIKAYLKNQRKK